MPSLNTQNSSQKENSQALPGCSGTALGSLWVDPGICIFNKQPRFLCTLMSEDHWRQLHGGNLGRVGDVGWKWCDDL